MFERFTPETTDTLRQAQATRQELGHGYCGVEHIMVALLQQRMVTRALTDAGLNVQRVAGKLRESKALEPSYKGPSPDAEAPWTPRAKKVLEFALREALYLQHTYIGPEHLIMGILREGGSQPVMEAIDRPWVTGVDLTARVRNYVAAHSVPPEPAMAQYYGSPIGDPIKE